MELKALTNILLNEHKEYRPIPFWSWNSSIEESELIKQIHDMNDVGIGGFIMHARSGLSIEYLGDKWFSCIDACLKEAKKLGMEAWIYDENGWPSGFVGGKLLKNESYLAQFLEYTVKDEYDEKAYAVYALIDGNYQLINNSYKTNKYHCIYLQTSPANTDILNPEVVDAFIEETHEEYYKRFKDSFGKELYGFFTDEPQYYRLNTPYSRFVNRELENENINIKENLIYLFISSEKGYSFRTKYYSTFNKLYIQNFYKKLYDWCSEHHCMLTGHSVEEMLIGSQMMTSSGVMGTYQYEHIPGIDWLSRNLPNDLIVRQLSSVASQFGKKDMLGEIFGCTSYDVTPRILRSLTDYFMFGGITRICNHLYPYSLSNQTKYDYPPVFSKHSNWYQEFKELNSYIERLGYIVGNTNEYYDVAIIHPIKSAYLEYNRKDDLLSVKQLDDDMNELLSILSQNGITYHFIDEEILKNNGYIKNDKIVIGKCAYKSIIIPKMDSISSTTLGFLNNFNGKICNLAEIKYVDGIPSEVIINSNNTLDEIINNHKLSVKTNGNIYITNRYGELGDFIMIKNKDNDNDVNITFDEYKQYRILDLVNMKYYMASNEMTIKALDSLILVKNEEDVEGKKLNDKEDITSSFNVDSISNNHLVIDYASYSFDNINYSEIMPIQKIFDILLRKECNERVYIKYGFNVTDLTKVSLLFEKNKYASMTLNGKEILYKTSNFDMMFNESDITDLLIIGYNEVIFGIDFFENPDVFFALFDPMATESLVNCLYYDTWIDSIYLKGDFSLDNNLSIIKKTLPNKINNIEQNGYPFFNGEFTISGNYYYDGQGKRSLTMDGNFLVGEILINNRIVNYILDNEVDISNLLKNGDNEIKIKVKISLRNLFGPLHYKQIWIFPQAFTFRTWWGENDPVDYTKEYTIKPIGVNKIEILKY